MTASRSGRARSRSASTVARWPMAPTSASTWRRSSRGSRASKDGGWNCRREQGSLRSSFDSTINVLEGLLAYERATGVAVLARASGEEYLLERGLFRRLSTGEPALARYLEFAHPSRWQYDVLRALDYFRLAGRRDARLAEAVEHVRSRRRSDGTWALDRRIPAASGSSSKTAQGDPP